MGVGRSVASALMFDHFDFVATTCHAHKVGRVNVKHLNLEKINLHGLS